MRNRMADLQKPRFINDPGKLTLGAWRIIPDPTRGNDMTTNSRRRGFFRSAMDAMIASREREAKRYVNDMLLSFDDRTLAAYGYKRSDLTGGK